MADTLITIGRQFGSCGRIIGEKIAEKLGIPCYDKQLIKRAAKESGLWEELLDQMDEKPTNSFLYTVVMDPYAYSYSFDKQGYSMNLNQKAFMATFSTIEKLANEGPGVFIGRCADYILRENPRVLNVFIYAPLEDRIKTVMERFDLSEKHAKDQIQKEDKARASYYNYYTSNKWGKLESYDLSVNSSLLGPEATADLIIDASERLLKRA